MVNLQKQKEYRSTQAWEKAELEDGWFKLRSLYGDFILDLNENGQKLKLSHNQMPCQGRKPCLRWVNNDFLVDILIFNSIFQFPILWIGEILNTNTNYK